MGKRPRGKRAWLVAVIGMAVFGVLVTVAARGTGSAAASTPGCHSWTGVPLLNPGTSGRLNGVAVISACDVWAVGTVIEHWNGSAWTVVPIPDPSPGGGGGVLRSVQAASSTDIWAVGSYGAEDNGDSPLIVHWNGTRWAEVASPSPGSSPALTGVGAASPANAWAVGQLQQRDHPQPGPGHPLLG